MNGEAKISSAHRDRLAVIYLRQSSMAQVREHTESTTRQYGLAEVAVALGWARADVLVIDTDLGVSGRWGVVRVGFTELVSRVCSGEVGAIFGIEISGLTQAPLRALDKTSCSPSTAITRYSPTTRSRCSTLRPPTATTPSSNKSSPT
jgi:hypothetical protein